MSFAESEGPPAKKRRFFTESSDILDASIKCEPSLPDKTDAFPSDLAKETPIKNEVEQSESSNGTHDHDVRAQDCSPGGFDLETFESFIGDKVAPDVLRRLREASGDTMERAVNMYFDGSWKTATKPSNGTRVPPKTMTINSFAKPTANGCNSKGALKSEHSKAKVSPPPLRDSMPEYRYIGAFGVGGWATRSGTSLLNHGDKVKIERQKIQPKSTKLSATRRVDVVVRFTDTKGSEIGRLPRDTANWVSTLIDEKVCRFEGTCVYAPERIRTNDTIFLQLRCSLLRTAFDNDSFRLADNRTTGMFEEKETSEEKQLRLRQVALVKVFEEVNLLPSRTTSTTAKHKREGLLQAAEVAEQYEQSKAKAEKRETKGGDTSEEAEDGQELEQDQLDSLYKKAQSFDFDAPAAEPADTFAMDLRHYQKQALHWMMSKEKNEKNKECEVSMHPLWEEYSWPTKDMDDKETTKIKCQDSFYVNPYSGELSLKFPVQEQNCLGGILADEMGLGKTIEMMSLVHSQKSEVWESLDQNRSAPTSVNSLPRLPATHANVEWAPCTTLVVAPMSLLAQWQSEAENASKDGTLRSMVYYGSEKSANLQTLCCEINAASAPNVIVTSYGVLLSEFNQVAARGGDRATYGGLFSLKYFRVILDEAHHIKNRQSKTAKACYEIEADHRWVLTGTPIVNRLEDLFSLVRFLRVEPWSNFSFWRTFITVPFESKNFMRALDVVQTVLEPLVLRRTKDMKTPTGEALVPLPPKTIKIVNIELSDSEREIYDYIFTRARRTFQATVEAGTVLRSYTSIFAQIMRLRQSCCHPILTRNLNVVADEEDAAEVADAASGLADDMDLQSLIERFAAETDDSANSNAFGAHVLEQIRDEAENECPICSEEPMCEQTVTGCWHSACKKCLLDYIKHQTDKGEIPRCFSCREPLNTRDIFEVVRDEGHPESKIGLQRLGSNSSAKIGELLGNLKALRKEGSGIKSVVFSQFTSFLSLIEPALTRAGLPFMRLDGSMAQKTRAAVLKEFASSKKGIVLLLSLRAGGVGLNLTMAKRVYMMDPWWSFAVEAQAIDRVHRMGQVDEVQVCRFIVKDSIEEKMLRIQDRKKFIASSLGMMSDEEKKLQRIEDIKELLS
ncbi:putative DNA repair protein rad-5 [Amylocarpus encephaloides]|uniref:DNA repair protein rad-5 n=1 Tax=Amylocarpus encephaloides TaxID=45428 RepID=A0A9P8C522_9HELO|nr:putative DNA repair protein rad-5 [Amylocarpus encephaloides]